MTMHIFTRFSRIMLIVFLTFTFTVPFAVAQVVDIPDANLRTKLKILLNKAPGDAITKADMQTLTLFSAVNAGIEDLTGLEHATNLLWLELDTNAISDITPLTRLSKLALLYLENNPLSAESVDKHIPVLLDRGVDVSYTLPSDVNNDGMVNIQDLVSVTQHFGAAGDLTADVNRDGIVNIRDLTQVAGNLSTNAVTMPTDGGDTVDGPAAVPPDETPVRDEAFIFKAFIDQLIADLRSVVTSYDDADFQPPGYGFHIPNRGNVGLRTRDLHILGTFVPDLIVTATVEQINIFSAKYRLTREELRDLLENMRRAVILIADPLYHIVYMPDENLRKVVIAKINELGISLAPINRPKELSDPIYAGEMWEIEELTARGAGIEQLTGLEYATDLKTLLLGNIITQGEVIIVGGVRTIKRAPDPEMPNIISDLRPLKELTNLINLGLSLNEIEDLSPLADLTNLRSLGLGENKITDIRPLADLTNLKSLHLGNALVDHNVEWAGDNEINDLTPLRDLTNLESLVVDENPVGSSISIVRNFPKLKILSISCCGVSDLSPLVGSPGLRAGSYAQVVHNPLPVAAIPGIEALEGRGVKVVGPSYWRDEKGRIRDFDNHLDWCR